MESERFVLVLCWMDWGVLWHRSYIIQEAYGQRPVLLTDIVITSYSAGVTLVDALESHGYIITYDTFAAELGRGVSSTVTAHMSHRVWLLPGYVRPHALTP